MLPFASPEKLYAPVELTVAVLPGVPVNVIVAPPVPAVPEIVKVAVDVAVKFAV